MPPSSNVWSQTLKSSIIISSHLHINVVIIDVFLPAISNPEQNVPRIPGSEWSAINQSISHFQQTNSKIQKPNLPAGNNSNGTTPLVRKEQEH